jgi:uncharacterized membrane protein YecN with MAPEG domain
MILPVTLLTAGLLTLWYVFISLKVSLARGREQVALGSGGDSSALNRLVRVHGNAAEYVPLFIVLLAVLEFHELRSDILYVLAGIFLLGRVLHRRALIGASVKLRIWAMQFTLWPLAISALILLYTWFAQVIIFG